MSLSAACLRILQNKNQQRVEARRRRLLRAFQKQRGFSLHPIEPRLLLSADDPVAALVTTDKVGYAPGETATITASNFQVGETINLAVLRDGQNYSQWAVADGSASDLDGSINGSIETTLTLPSNSPGSDFVVTASGATSALSDDAAFEGLITWVQAVPTDYAPGETANIFAGGFQLGESVLFEVSNLTAGFTYTPPWSVVDGSANDLDGLVDGHIQTGWLVPESALNTTLRVTALGEASGLTAENTFTDSRTITSVTLNGGTSVTVTSGATISTVMNVTTDNSGGNQNWRATRWLISTTAPANGAGMTLVDFEPDHEGSGNYSENFSITAPSSPGTYNAYFFAYSDDDGVQNNQASVLFTLTNAVIVVAPTVSIAKINDAAEPGTNGKFRVTQSAATSTNTTVTYSVNAASTATGGNDYTALSGTATILAGTTTVDIDVVVINDAVVEVT